MGREIPERSGDVRGRDLQFQFVAVALWFGLITGVGEVLLRGVRRYLLHQFNYLGPYVVWMAPLVDVIVFGAIGLMFYVSSRWTRHTRGPSPTVTACAFTSALIILMMYQPLHPLARVLLAAGIGLQFGRLAARRPDAVLRPILTTLAWPTLLWRAIRRSGQPDRGANGVPASLERRDFLIGTGATLGGLALGVHGFVNAREWLGARRLPPARPGAPNVLLLVLDTVRAASLSLHGYGRETTPALTRFAQRGALFHRAYSHSPWTLPSHGSMFTGRYPHELSGTWQTALDAAHPVLAEVLAAAGYSTAGFVANSKYCSYEAGLQRGFLHFEDYPVSPGEILNSSVLLRYLSEHDAVAGRRRHELLGRRTAAAINEEFLSWLSDQGERPFFAFLNYFDAHAPYLPPAPFDTRFGAAASRPNPRHVFGWQWTPEQVTAEQRAYDGAIAYLDAEIDRLLTELAARRRLDNTIVVVTSDHGELFGEHGLIDHANSLHVRLLHVPLLLVWPERIPAAVAITQPVGLRHLAATILDLTGATTRLPGRSWSRLWRSGGSAIEAPEPVFARLEQGIRVEPHWRNANGDLHSVIIETRHYIRDSGGGEELYDLSTDPSETVNLAATTDTELFRRALDQFRREGSTRP